MMETHPPNTQRSQATLENQTLDFISLLMAWDFHKKKKRGNSPSQRGIPIIKSLSIMDFINPIFSIGVRSKLVANMDTSPSTLLVYLLYTGSIITQQH